MTRLAALGLATALAALAGPATAQEFPSQPITIINPYSAGGPADLISRTIGEGMAKVLGQPVVIENKPGAATAIAASHVAQAAPDGYTLLIAGSPTHIITPALQEVTYKGIEDFTPVSMVANVPNVLVVQTASGIKTVADLVAKSTAEPDAVSFASVGNGSLPHLSSVLFSKETGAQMVHIPYGGAAPAVVDLLAGNVDMGFLNAPPLMAHFASGDLTALAIASPERSPQLPDVPTMQEAGFAEFDMATWYGISAPAGTPAEAVAKLDAAIAETLKDPEVTAKLTNLGVVVFYKTSTDFGAFLTRDEGRMIDLLATAGVKKQ